MTELTCRKNTPTEHGAFYQLFSSFLSCQVCFLAFFDTHTKMCECHFVQTNTRGKVLATKEANIHASHYMKLLTLGEVEDLLQHIETGTFKWLCNRRGAQ